MKQLTEFGKAVKIELIKRGLPQIWLIDRVRDATGLYFDDSYLSKILTGALKTPKITAAICEILEIKQEA